MNGAYEAKIELGQTTQNLCNFLTRTKTILSSWGDHLDSPDKQLAVAGGCLGGQEKCTKATV